MSNDRVLVVGGAGMIGSNVVKQLLEKGEKVTIFDNFSAYPFNTIQRFGLKGLKNLSIIKGDITNKKQVDDLTKKGNKLINLCSLADVGACIKDPNKNFDTDIIGNYNLLNSAKENKIEKFVFASSASVYGSPTWVEGMPPKVSEDANLRPTTPYANSKLFNEQQLRLWYELYDFPTTSLRYFSVWGAPQIPKENSFSWNIAIFTLQCMKNKPMTIIGDGSQCRDYTHVEDIAKATVDCLDNEKTNGQIFNVGTGLPTTILKTAHLIGKEFDNYNLSYSQKIKGDPWGCFCDNSLMKKLLGWVPRPKLENKLSEYINWWRQNKENIPSFI